MLEATCISQKSRFSPDLASPENYQAVSPENKGGKTPGTSEIQTFGKLQNVGSLGLCGVILFLDTIHKNHQTSGSLRGEVSEKKT